jgi:hydrogenase-4 membrane subunit HyfE
MAEDHHASHGHSLLNHLRRSVKREAGVMEHPDLANGKSTRMRPLLPIAILLLSIIVISLHGVGGFVLLKAGLGGLSLHDPLAYVLIGLFLVLAVLKLKHVVGFMHRKEKREDAGKARKG